LGGAADKAAWRSRWPGSAGVGSSGAVRDRLPAPGRRRCRRPMSRAQRGTGCPTGLVDHLFHRSLSPEEDREYIARGLRQGRGGGAVLFPLPARAGDI